MNDCFGCGDLFRDALGNARRVRHDSLFMDSRTGRQFCHECVSALASWELDGRPEPAEHPYPFWIGECEFPHPHDDLPCGRDLAAALPDNTEGSVANHGASDSPTQKGDTP